VENDRSHLSIVINRLIFQEYFYMVAQNAIAFIIQFTSAKARGSGTVNYPLGA